MAVIEMEVEPAAIGATAQVLKLIGPIVGGAHTATTDGSRCVIGIITWGATCSITNIADHIIDCAPGRVTELTDYGCYNRLVG